MKFAIRWAVVLLLGIFVSVAVAQEDESGKLAQRVTRLEGFTGNIDGKFNNEAQKLELKFEKYKKEADDKIQQADDRGKELELRWKKKEFELSENYRQVKHIAWIFGSVSVVGLGILFFSVWISLSKLMNKKIPEIAEAKAKERFDRHFSEEFERRFHAKEGDIKRLIRLQDEEALLRKNKKVLVLSKAGTDTGFLKRFFEKMGFENVAFETFEPSRQYRNNDLILINNRDKCFDDPEIISYHEKVPEKTVYFCLGQGIVRYPGNPDNVAFTNAIFQLYGNLINALRHQDMLGDS